MELSFKEQAHNEMLTVLPRDKACITAFLAAVAKVTGSIEFSKRHMNLSLQLEGYEDAVAIVELFESLYPTQFEINAEHARSGIRAGKRVFSVRVPSGFSKQALIDLYLMRGSAENLTEFNSCVPTELFANHECTLAYIRGLFFCCGSVYVPSVGDDGEKRVGYHFELHFDDEDFAEQVRETLYDMRINAKISERGASRLVYVKDKDEIMDLLAMLGLVDSALKLQAIIDERETANSINRATICEAANLDKTYTAASKHLLAIGTIEESEGLDSLSATLHDTACARMEYPQASMSELAEILGVSKSCLNHRLRKLCEIAQIE